MTVTTPLTLQTICEDCNTVVYTRKQVLLGVQQAKAVSLAQRHVMLLELPLKGLQEGSHSEGQEFELLFYYSGHNIFCCSCQCLYYYNKKKIQR